MIYKEVQADLFDYYDKGYYVAQCLSADLVAGAGIAVEFNNRLNMKNKLLKRYPDGAYIKGKDENGISFKRFIPQAILQDRVFNLITKDRVWEKPTLGNLGLSLSAMRIRMTNMKLSDDINVNKIALPLIGCGIDGLEWFRVRELIEKVFGDMDIEIVVCYLEKDRHKVEEI